MCDMSTRTPSRRLSAPERRQRILSAAEQVFGAHGYHDASIGEIAAAAGISKPVLYDHFASKHELYVTLMDGISRELTDRGAAAMAAAASGEARIRTAIEAFFTFVEERPQAARVLLVTPFGEPELADDARRVQAGASARLAALLAAETRLLAGAGDRERRLELYAEFLRAGLHGLAEWWREHPEAPRAELVDAAMGLTWEGLSGPFGSGG
jgi:AcrR family transcriptional regulator